METTLICYGTGLVALDVILNGKEATLPKLSTGGSCGNVLSILRYLGWESYPIARLADNGGSEALLTDLRRWGVRTDYLTITKDGSTPIIIHRILTDKGGNPIHRFEFRDPQSKSWLPQFKPITKVAAAAILQKKRVPALFYFDRMNPGTLDLVKHFRDQGSVIFFEPSSDKDIKQFEKFVAYTDILKFSEDRLPDYKIRYPDRQCFLEIETRGKEGLAYRSAVNPLKNEWKALEGYAIPDVRDAAGAGDWCSAGIIARLGLPHRTAFTQVQEANVETALYFGQFLGALNCFYDGARGLMYHYTQEEFDKLVQTDAGHQALLNDLARKEKPAIVISRNVSLASLY